MDTPVVTPDSGSSIVRIGFGASLVLHLGLLFLVKLPPAPQVVVEAPPDYQELETVPVPPPRPKVQPPKPQPVKSQPQQQANRSGSAARRVFQTKAGDSGLASVKDVPTGAVEGNSVNGQGTGAGNFEGTGSGAGDPKGTGTAPTPEPPPPAPPPGPPTKARPITNASPVYPESARAAGHVGKVLVIAYIDENGNVTKTKVKNSSGFPELDQAAEDAVMKMKFEPATQDGKPIPSKVGVPINFDLT
jgi:protein TonB